MSSRPVRVRQVGLQGMSRPARRALELAPGPDPATQAAQQGARVHAKAPQFWTGGRQELRGTASAAPRALLRQLSAAQSRALKYLTRFVLTRGGSPAASDSLVARAIDACACRAPLKADTRAAIESVLFQMTGPVLARRDAAVRALANEAESFSLLRLIALSGTDAAAGLAAELLAPNHPEIRELCLDRLAGLLSGRLHRPADAKVLPGLKGVAEAVPALLRLVTMAPPRSETRKVAPAQWAAVRASAALALRGAPAARETLLAIVGDAAEEPRMRLTARDALEEVQTAPSHPSSVSQARLHPLIEQLGDAHEIVAVGAAVALLSGWRETPKHG